MERRRRIDLAVTFMLVSMLFGCARPIFYLSEGQTFRPSDSVKQNGLSNLLVNELLQGIDYQDWPNKKSSEFQTLSINVNDRETTMNFNMNFDKSVDSSKLVLEGSVMTNEKTDWINFTILLNQFDQRAYKMTLNKDGTIKVDFFLDPIFKRNGPVRTFVLKNLKADSLTSSLVGYSGSITDDNDRTFEFYATSDPIPLLAVVGAVFAIPAGKAVYSWYTKGKGSGMAGLNQNERMTVESSNCALNRNNGIKKDVTVVLSADVAGGVYTCHCN